MLKSKNKLSVVALKPLSIELLKTVCKLINFVKKIWYYFLILSNLYNIEFAKQNNFIRSSLTFENVDIREA